MLVKSPDAFSPEQKLSSYLKTETSFLSCFGNYIKDDDYENNDYSLYLLNAYQMPSITLSPLYLTIHFHSLNRKFYVNTILQIRKLRHSKAI